MASISYEIWCQVFRAHKFVWKGKIRVSADTAREAVDLAKLEAVRLFPKSYVKTGKPRVA